MPKASEILIRLMYVKEVPNVRDWLKKIADLEDEIDGQEEMIFKLTKISEMGRTARRTPTSANWVLLAA